MANSVPSYNLTSVFNDPKALENATFSRPLTTDERKTKLRIEEWNAKVGYVKDVLLWVMAIVSVGIFVYICLSLINNPISSADDKKWATSIISSMTTGLIGYLTGKSQKA
jgi:hypothetical protein